MNESPGYNAVIPAPVRYCEALTPNAKLLYGEISALCNTHGFCWASNKYFADLYKVSSPTISEWVNSLKRHGFVLIEANESMGNQRKIRLITGLKEITGGSSEKAEEGYSETMGVIGKSRKGSSENPESSIEENNTKKNEALPFVLWDGQKPKPGDLFLHIIPDEFRTSFPFADSWRGFIEMRMGQKWTLTNKSARDILAKLRQWGIEKSIRALDAAALNCWRDVYDPDDRRASRGSNGRDPNQDVLHG